MESWPQKCSVGSDAKVVVGEGIVVFPSRGAKSGCESRRLRSSRLHQCSKSRFQPIQQSRVAIKQRLESECLIGPNRSLNRLIVKFMIH